VWTLESAEEGEEGEEKKAFKEEIGVLNDGSDTVFNNLQVKGSSNVVKAFGEFCLPARKQKKFHKIQHYLFPLRSDIFDAR